MPLSLIFLVTVVVLAALIFALTNGLHDASSVVATMIACGAATPIQAVFLAAVFGLTGAVLGGSAVANTIAKIVNVPIQPDLLWILLAALIGAVAWNLITWYLGLPSSSTHALVGGLIGAVGVARGLEHVLWGWQELWTAGHLTGVSEIAVALLISPLLGFITAYFLQKISEFLFRNATFAINKHLNRLQWVMGALLAYSHGANDTQKVIGLINLALLSAGILQQPATPVWVRLAGGSVMFLGTLFGGWSIMKTLGRGIFEIRPVHSMNSQLASASSILLATYLGAPVSTTHIVTGSVIGVGTADEHRMVNWMVGKEMVVAWGVTMPAAAGVAGICYFLISLLK